MSSLSIEENAGSISLVVMRSQPAFGTALVTVLSMNGTALVVPNTEMVDFQPV